MKEIMIITIRFDREGESLRKLNPGNCFLEGSAENAGLCKNIPEHKPAAA
jgi:hypothetical protein